MMIKFSPLFSGSSGNALYLKYKETSILIDAGSSKKRISNAIDYIGEKAHVLNAIIVTHEHIDHTSGLGVMERGYDIPVYANKATWNAITRMNKIGKIRDYNKRLFCCNEKFTIGDIEIKPFSVSHDAADPSGFSFFMDTKKITVITDTGKVDEQAAQNIRASDILLIEANYDTDMLLNGDYPYYLKKRINGLQGHLCNDRCGLLIAENIKHGLKTVILGHRSADNNRPDIAYETVKKCIQNCGYNTQDDIKLVLAKRAEETVYDKTSIAVEGEDYFLI